MLIDSLAFCEVLLLSVLDADTDEPLGVLAEFAFPVESTGASFLARFSGHEQPSVQDCRDGQDAWPSGSRERAR